MAAAAGILAVSLASTAFQVSEQRKAKKKAEKEAKQQQEEANKQQLELKSRVDTEKDRENQLKASTLRRRRGILTSRGSSRSTVRTSPLGLIANSRAGANKTLGS